MKEQLPIAILIVILLTLLFLLSGCSTVKPMRECKEIGAEGFEDYWLCKPQWKIWS